MFGLPGCGWLAEIAAVRAATWLDPLWAGLVGWPNRRVARALGRVKLFDKFTRFGGGLVVAGDEGHSDG